MMNEWIVEKREFLWIRKEKSENHEKWDSFSFLIVGLMSLMIQRKFRFVRLNKEMSCNLYARKIYGSLQTKELCYSTVFLLVSSLSGFCVCYVMKSVEGMETFRMRICGSMDCLLFGIIMQHDIQFIEVNWSDKTKLFWIAHVFFNNFLSGLTMSL